MSSAATVRRRRPRLVLLGASGQLGGDFLRAHASAGEPFAVTALARRDLNVGAPAQLDRLAELRFDALVNCTGYHNTDLAEDNAALAFAVNAEAVRRLARLCAANNACLLHISTDYVFGADRGRRDPLPEQAPIGPLNVYGASKALGEALAFAECEQVLLFRVASLFGVAGARAKGGNFVETMIRRAGAGPLRVVDDQIMSPTATTDVAAAMLRALAEGRRGVYHVVNSGAASWFAFATAILAGAGSDAMPTPCATRDYPSRALRPAYSVLDNAKAAAFAHLPPWQDALARYLRERRRA